MEDCLEGFNENWKSGVALFDHESSLKYHPVNQFDEAWVKNAMLDVSKLFLKQNGLNMNDPSEADLIHKVWPFLYKLYEQGEIEGRLGERCSVALAIARNDRRSLEAEQKRADVW